jgi:FHS family Na+ dependent glucose MFS transporter 1
VKTDSINPTNSKTSGNKKLKAFKFRLHSLKPALGYFGATFALGMVISSLGPTIPSLAQITGSSLAAAGMLFSGRSLGYLLGSLLVGRGYDRYPGNSLLAIVLFGAAFSMVLVPISPWLGITAVILFITGLGLGGIDVGSNALTVWRYREKASPYLNALYLFAGLGGLFIPLLVGRMLTAGLDIKVAYWLLAILITPPAFWLLFQPSPSPLEEVQESAEKKANIPLIVMFGSLFFIFVGSEVSFGGWIYTYIINSDLGDIATASMINSLFWLALTIGRLLAIPISARVRPERVLSFNLFAGVISLGIFLIWPHSLVGVGVGTFGLGFSLASNFPMTYSLAERHLHITGRLTGILWALGSFGAMVTPWLIGNLIERFDPTALAATLFIYMLSGLGLLFSIRVYIQRLKIL